MKKLLCGCIMAGLLLLAACSNNNTTPVNTTVNGWSFKGNTYYTLVSTVSGDTVSASTDTIGNYARLIFVFPSQPVAGSYHVINYGTPASNQVAISLHTLGQTSYFRSLGNDNVNATVTVTNGRVAVFVPNVNLLSSTTSNDTSQLYATITQTQ